MAGIEKFTKKYGYIPLSMYSIEPNNVIDAKCELRRHLGCANDDYRENRDIDLAPDSLIYHGKISKPKLLICVTMYNEPFSQLIESLAGIYRSYYEL